MGIAFANTENKIKCSKFFNSSCMFLIEVVLDVDIHPRTVYIAGNVLIISKSYEQSTN